MIKVERTGERLVLRRLGDWSVGWDDEITAREMAILQALRNSGVPVPEALWFGKVSGLPSIVTRFVDGRGHLGGRSPVDSANQLAAALAEIHAVELGEPLVSLLARAPVIFDEEPSAGFFEHPAAAPLLKAVRETSAVTSTGARRTLTHGDFWPGNTLWKDEKLVAVIDWESSRLDDPLLDVAYCATDLRYLGLDDAADQLINRYASLTGAPQDTLEYWTLVALCRPLPDIEPWVSAWTSNGYADVDLAVVKARQDRLIETALAGKT